MAAGDQTAQSLPPPEGLLFVCSRGEASACAAHRWQVAQLDAGRTQNLVLGKYILLAPLGAGGMGAVYRARDPDANREVAVKVLPSRLTTAESVARFRREALAALQMRHEHVVAAYEVGEQGALHFRLFRF